MRVQLTRTWPTIAVAMIVMLLVGLQVTASNAGFQGPLHSLISDYVAAPKSATVSWVGFGVAMAGLPNRCRIVALSVAVVLDPAHRTLRCAVGAVARMPLRPLEAEAWIASCIDWEASRTLDPQACVAFGEYVAAACIPDPPDPPAPGPGDGTRSSSLPGLT